MTVGPDLLKAAEANDQAAIDMVSIWGLGFRPSSAAAWRRACGCMAARSACCSAAAPGVLFTDLAACNAYQDALAAAAQVTVPTTLILGERDMMTPAKAGKALAAAMPQARTMVLPGAGHMMMTERPDAVLAALRP